jgi:hypothetical protein
MELIKGGKGDNNEQEKKGIDIHISISTEDYDFEKNATVDTFDELKEVLSDVPAELEQVMDIFAEFDELDEIEMEEEED